MFGRVGGGAKGWAVDICPIGLIKFILICFLVRSKALVPS